MSQIIRSSIPQNILRDLLVNICQRNQTYFIFNNEAYKKGNMYNLFEPFVESLKPYYYNSKQFYLERNISFKMLATIVRQICNVQNIIYTNHIKYNKSNHEIHYYIYL